MPDPDRDSVERFLDENLGSMMRLSVVLTSSSQDAEDLVQDTLVRVLRHWDKLSAARSPQAYLRRVLLNESARRRRVAWQALPTGVSEDEKGFLRVDDRQHSTRLLANLPPRQAAAIALRYLDDASYAEIAAALRCRETTARSLVSRGLGHLRSVEGLAPREV